jgi:hypothetical protein
MRCALILALALAACSKPARSVDWFAAHPEETNRVLQQCGTHQQTDAECDAARNAVLKKQDQRLKLFRNGF